MPFSRSLYISQSAILTFQAIFPHRRSALCVETHHVMGAQQITILYWFFFRMFAKAKQIFFEISLAFLPVHLHFCCRLSVSCVPQWHPAGV